MSRPVGSLGVNRTLINLTMYTSIGLFMHAFEKVTFSKNGRAFQRFCQGYLDIPFNQINVSNLH